MGACRRRRQLSARREEIDTLCGVGTGSIRKVHTSTVASELKGPARAFPVRRLEASAFQVVEDTDRGRKGGTVVKWRHVQHLLLLGRMRGTFLMEPDFGRPTPMTGSENALVRSREVEMAVSCVGATDSVGCVASTATLSAALRASNTAIARKRKPTR